MSNQHHTTTHKKSSHAHAAESEHQSAESPEELTVNTRQMSSTVSCLIDDLIFAQLKLHGSGKSQ